jgi:hypothetical protein
MVVIVIFGPEIGGVQAMGINANKILKQNALFTLLLLIWLFVLRPFFEMVSASIAPPLLASAVSFVKLIDCNIFDKN